MGCWYDNCRHRTRGAAALSTVALLISNDFASAVATAPRRPACAIAKAPPLTSCYRQSSAAFVFRPSSPSKRPRHQPHGSSWTSRDILVAPHRAGTGFRCIATITASLHAKPKSGSIVDSYQTVSVNCSKCRTRLFRYKKKNGLKSNLIKCYIERISEDSAKIIENLCGVDGDEDGGGGDGNAPEGQEWSCPDCGQRFGRRTLIHGRPAIKLVGGKVRMTKK